MSRGSARRRLAIVAAARITLPNTCYLVAAFRAYTLWSVLPM